MVEVRVAGVALDAGGQHVILLQPIEATPGESKLLPIWIGPMEATSIMVAIEGTDTPRPLTHDLVRTMLDTLGVHVDRVEVTRIENSTFYAEITLNAGSGIQRIDARPSDAIAIASRTGAPMFVADAVLAEAGVDDVISDAEAEADVEEFTKFLEDVDPDDFRE
ncbi:bifunctional nuclease family protein [Microbacterium sp.]|uniref:bifunctional nuclease family protein n=1 Tax=Microbacterium sp. TaxID=51671 RepID=UPI003A930AC8